ncbi:RBBP9/YdeN family alpha/beta hydrolase [Dysgonomonas sp. HGC4]|uniref:RBBP9/YdeN family alpha/beta hydrolase n=1 Tax=Dysgonomonas sp. HGC4 TaxID=1658009 RepID=UPI000683575C|nr:alpha/beta fold hydrolase [Dysgonomonas sp. HGC4]MBD8349205.1 serine hydrolase family protein [Dysgonomonas sp. HGC4]
MNNYFIVPGLGNSGPDHWQTFFEKSGDNFTRIEQQGWDAPNCHEWIKNIDDVVSKYDLSTVILIGHSLGCITIAHWAKQSGKKIKGALLVAPSDIESPFYTFTSSGFTPISLEKINFNTIVVASTNDPWVSMKRVELFTKSWGSTLINIGDAGHINAASGYGEWQEGLEILKKLG